MQSRWFELKPQAVQLRKKGYSIRKIEDRLGIPRSTLNGWFKDITLTRVQKDRLLNDWKKALINAREAAVLWHNKQKMLRLKKAEEEASKVFKKLNANDATILDLALAMLYLGEGFKSNTTSIGNSNPLILRFFITVMVKNYQFDKGKIKCELHLRADQNPNKLKGFWARELDLPLENFTSVSIDKRTIGTKTYPYYKGVCVLRCGTVAIQRKLLYLSQMFCNEVAGARG